jgi:hypothetical protein
LRRPLIKHDPADDLTTVSNSKSYDDANSLTESIQGTISTETDDTTDSSESDTNNTDLSDLDDSETLDYTT